MINYLDREIQKSELDALHFTEWVVSTQPNEVGGEGSGIYFYSGFQTYNSSLPKDEEGNYTLCYVALNQQIMDKMNELEEENRVYDYTYDSDTTEGKLNFGMSIFSEYYHSRMPLEEGQEKQKTVSYAGCVDFDVCKVMDGEEQVGIFMISCTYDHNRMLQFLDTIPCKNPSTIESKAREADNKVSQALAEGFTPNAVNLATTFLSLDGTEPDEPIIFKYDDASQAELLKAFTACRAGMISYTLRIPGRKAASLPAEMIYRLYLECESNKIALENYAEYYKAYLYSRINEGKDKEDEISALEYGMDLPEPYATQLEEAQTASYAELQQLSEVLGIND